MGSSIDSNNSSYRKVFIYTQPKTLKPNSLGYEDFFKSSCEEILRSDFLSCDLRGGKKPAAKSGEIYSSQTPKKTYQVSLSNLFVGDQFRLLKIVPVLLKYLLHDPAGIKLIKANKATLTKRKLASLTKLPQEHIEHFWRLVVPPEKRKHSNQHGMHLLDDLVNIKNMLWRCEDLFVMWRSEDKELLLKDKGYTSKEAKAFLSLLTPNSHKASGKTSKSDLLAFKEEIEQVDFSWTEDTTPFS